MSSSPGNRTGRECAEYMDSVLSGEIVACDKIKKLCRMMRPRIDGGYKCWHYDADRALRPVNFIERYCCLPEGKPGRKIALEPFQLFVLEMLFGFVDDNGLRQFHECMWVVGRKNSKTTTNAALAIYMLMADGEGSPQCYSAATSKDQASLLYGSMLRMVAQSPALSKRLHKGIIPARNQDGLQYRRNGGYFTPLSSQTRNLDGLNVHFAAIDEMAAITNRDTYDLIKQATPSRDQPLIIEITTNGFERDNLFDDQYDYASRILDGKAVDDTFLPVIYELDSRAEWTDESKWIKANPGLGPIKKVEALRGYVNKAKQDPSFLPTVMTKDFNIPENKASAWLRFEEAVNREEFDYREMGFRYCIIGYDASDTIDLTAAQALMMRPGDERMYEMSMYWIPETQLEKHIKSGLRKNRDNVPYQRWIDDGLVRVVPGNTIDHRVVFEWMQQLRDEFDIYPFAMGYDPWHLQDDSWKDGARQFVGKKRMEEVRFGPQTLSAPMKQIRADYEAKRIVDGNNPVNQWCRMNVGIITDTNDNIKPVKANGSTGRIDGWAAEICAYIALMRHREDYMASI
ncbi:terminase large subunit [Collinsella tanakaei]|uniref:terminase large subunit n=1 Tax=Collinsella tanakaei TaxID=626935 RepID=UPI00205A1BB9|nr:terminase TerL endonuclease subunit [Collinsella tanakaei]DAU57884.1 MAG TPA: Large Terminase [Caudoviricetes sp.]